MRFRPFVLVVYLALLESGSQASKVRGTSAFDRTTEAASETDNQHGRSFLPTTKDEDRMFKNLLKVHKTPDGIVKKRLMKLIPSLEESSSSARPPTNVQGHELHALSDEQKIRLGVNFIRENSLQELIKAFKPFKRKSGEDEVDVIFSAMRKYLGEDVATKVLLNVEKAKVTSGYNSDKLMKAQFEYWITNEKSDAVVFASLRKLESEEEKVENYGRNAMMLDKFIHFRNNGNPDDESLFNTLTHGDGMLEFAVFISEGTSNPSLLKRDAINLKKRYFKLLTRKHMTAGDLFDTLLLKNDEVRMFIGPKFDLLSRYAEHQTQGRFLARTVLGVYREKLGMKDLAYWLARAAETGEIKALKDNAKYLTNFLFKYFLESDDAFKAMIEKVKTRTDGGTDAANFLEDYRSAYKQGFEMNLRGLEDPFKRHQD